MREQANHIRQQGRVKETIRGELLDRDSRTETPVRVNSQEEQTHGVCKWILPVSDGKSNLICFLLGTRSVPAVNNRLDRFGGSIHAYAVCLHPCLAGQFYSFSLASPANSSSLSGVAFSRVELPSRVLRGRAPRAGVIHSLNLEASAVCQSQLSNWIHGHSPVKQGWLTNSEGQPVRTPAPSSTLSRRIFQS